MQNVTVLIFFTIMYQKEKEEEKEEERKRRGEAEGKKNKARLITRFRCLPKGSGQ